MFDFGVWLKDGKTYIGDIALKNLDYRIPKAEIALHFTSWPGTKAYAQEALQEIRSFAFDTLGMNKVYMRCCAAAAFYEDLPRHAALHMKVLCAATTVEWILTNSWT